MEQFLETVQMNLQSTGHVYLNLINITSKLYFFNGCPIFHWIFEVAVSGSTFLIVKVLDMSKYFRKLVVFEKNIINIE